jgi:lysophospholipase L1-like esterase
MKRTLLIIVVVVAALLGYRALFPGGPEVRNPQPGGRNIICFGDSLTYGTGAAPGSDYPSQLSALISRPVVNAGVPGDTTADALQRLANDVLSRDPRIVLITLGGNDLKNGVPRETAFENLKRMTTAIQDRGALVVIGGISFPVRDRGFGQGYRDLAEEAGVVLIPNILEGIMGRRDLMSDPIHPNSAGYAIMAERFHEALRPYL